MKCIKCGAEIKSSSKFCRYCGTSTQKSIDDIDAAKLQDDNIDIENKVGRCSNCGEVIQSGNIFCTSCGMPYKNNYKIENSDMIEKQNKPKKNSVGFVVITAVIIVIFVVIVAVFGLRENGIFYSLISTEVQTIDVMESSKFEDKSETTSIEEITEDINIEKINVDEDVKEARILYNNISSAISDNRYQYKELREGIIVYYDGQILKAIIVPNNVDGIKYKRSYYYDNDKLCFALYEGYEVHRFYFINDKLIRWQYSADASDSQSAINYDLKNTLEYNEWENEVLNDSSVFAGSADSVVLHSGNNSSKEKIVSNQYDKDEIENVILTYCKGLCDAVNKVDYSIIRPYIKEGSPLEKMQIKLIDYLDGKGTKEAFVGADIKNVVIENNNAYAFVNEWETLYYSNGKSETNEYNWKYSLVKESGEWKLTNLEKP